MIKGDLNRYLIEVKDKVDITPKNGPSQRSLVKHRYSFSEKSLSEQLIIWDYIWNNSSDIWICVQAFFFIESKMKDEEFLLDTWDVIKKWQKKIDNWGLCDALSKIYTKILEIIPERVLKQLQQWNKSTNLWDRRQSLISLLYFSRTKKVFLPFDTIINLLNELVNDPEYYVQKAVGWTLRELCSVYPNETKEYLENKIKDISPIAFTIAIEKLDRREKEKLKNIRKSSRTLTDSKN
jgi:3-methyladenine DNA glycosylase AlkD